MRFYVNIITALIVVISHPTVGRYVQEIEQSEFDSQAFHIKIDWNTFTVKPQMTALDTTAHRRIRRRAYVIRCCSYVSCTSNRKRGEGRYTPYSREALAVVSGDGIAVTCPRCRPGWQDDLDLGRGKGSITITCADCPDGWKDMLNVDAASEAPVDAETGDTEATEAPTEAATESAAVNAAKKTTIAPAAPAAAATTVAKAAAAAATTVAPAAAPPAATPAPVATGAPAATTPPPPPPPAATTKAPAPALPAGLPAGLDLSKLPPGVDLSKIPPGMDMSKIPAGMDLSKIPPGMDLASLAMLGKK